MSKYLVRDVADINAKNTNTSYIGNKINYLDTSNLTENKINNVVVYEYSLAPSRAKRVVQCNDILISTVRPNQKHYGIINPENEGLVVSTGFAVLTPKENVVKPMFLYYYLTQPKVTNYLSLIAATSTTSYPSIKPEVISDLVIDLPSLEEQKKIANVLLALDNKIEMNNQINKDLEELAQTLYTKWFVNFDFINKKGKPYKSSGGKMINSELGLIPDGWSIGTYCDFLKFEKGIEVGSSNYTENLVDNSVRFVRVKDMCSTNTNDYIYTDISHTKGKISESYDVLLSLDGSPGRISIGVNGCYSSGIRKVSLNDVCDGNIFVYTTLKSKIFQKAVINHATGVNIKHAGSVIDSFAVVIPPKKIIDEFCTYYEKLYIMLVNNILENNLLLQLRNNLLSPLMDNTITII